MNERQRRFCREYVKCGVQAEAARRAGYPDSEHGYARKHGHRLMTNDDVRRHIDELLEDADAVKELTPNAIATGILREARSADRAADRLRGYELLGKAQGMFREVHETKESQGIPALLEQIQKISPRAADELARELGISVLSATNEGDSGTNTEQPVENTG